MKLHDVFSKLKSAVRAGHQPPLPDLDRAGDLLLAMTLAAAAACLAIELHAKAMF